MCARLRCSRRILRVAWTPTLNLLPSLLLIFSLCHHCRRYRWLQDTQGVLSFIFLVVTGGYIYHIWRFRKENGVHFPCSRLN